MASLVKLSRAPRQVVSESDRTVVYLVIHGAVGWHGTKLTIFGRERGFPEATRMRVGAVLLISLSCAGCASSQKPVAEAPAPHQNAMLQNPAPDAEAAPARFECSDGTVSVSQSGCLINMARARLPPAQPSEQTPAASEPAR
jgi:hypothetical protein